MPLAPECQLIADELSFLELEKEALEQKYERKGIEPSGIDRQRINQLNNLIPQKSNELDQCRLEHPDTPPPPPAPSLNATFTGTVTFRTNHPQALGPFEANIQFGLRFSGNSGDTKLTLVTITDFPPIQTSDVIITKIGSAAAKFNDPRQGDMKLPVSLFFDIQSWFVGDSFIDVAPTTQTVFSPITNANLIGSPLKTDGKIKIVAAGKFREGFLAGKDGTTELEGSISPNPLSGRKKGTTWVLRI